MKPSINVVLLRDEDGLFEILSDSTDVIVNVITLEVEERPMWGEDEQSVCPLPDLVEGQWLATDNGAAVPNAGYVRQVAEGLLEYRVQ